MTVKHADKVNWKLDGYFIQRKEKMNKTFYLFTASAAVKRI